MNIIDTHSHLFAEEFILDLPQVIERARTAGVSAIVLPNIDCSTIEPMLNVAFAYPHFCYPTIGLHPTSVTANYKDELANMEILLRQEYSFVAIGEVGIDLYWDRTYLPEQIDAFTRQIQWALTYKLPLIIHTRDAFDEIYSALLPYKNEPLTGIFHSFTGTHEEAERLLEFQGFKLGINGVVTFKKSTLPAALKVIPLERLVLETDSPYLTPTPNRGKRNESANIRDTLGRIADLYEMTEEKIADVTSRSAQEVFHLP